MKPVILPLVILLIFITLDVFSQEIHNAPVNAEIQINNARTDGKPETNISQSYLKSDEISKIENRISELRISSNPNISEITNLQKKVALLSGQTVFSGAAFYQGSITLISMNDELDLVGNTTVLSKNNIKGIATVTEYTGATAGRIWAVAGFQGAGTSSTPDSLRVLFSTNNGLSWIAYANITLGGTDKINYGDIDVELIEGGTDKYLHIVYGLRANGGTGKWFAAGASIKLTGTFAGNVWTLNWPGDDASKRYYSPRITSDNVVWVTSPWVYIAVSFDSAGASGRVNTQKLAQWNSPNSVTPSFFYKTNKIYWYNETPTQQKLYTDIAFFQRGGLDSLIISFCGTDDSTKVFFSKMYASTSFISPSNPGQYIGPVGGSEPNFFKYGGKLSTNGNNNGSVFFIFNQKSAATDGVKYFRTTNFGYFNDMSQSVIWSASNGVSMPDITGVRGANTHRFGFFFWGSSSDSLKYVSVNSQGIFESNSARMNAVNLTTGLFPPAVGMRFVSGDSCFALYSASGPENVFAAYGCSGALTGIGNTGLPAVFELKQNYPNPFNPSTQIAFSISKAGFVSLKVYDVLGREVQTIVNEVKNSGNYIVDFDASGFSSGVYFYRLDTGGLSEVKKMLYVR